MSNSNNENEIIENENLYFLNTKKFVINNLFILLVLSIILLIFIIFSILSPTNKLITLNFITNNLNLILAFLIIFLIFYILVIFYNKGIEFNDLKSFVNTRTEILDTIFEDVNTNGSNFEKNDKEICDKLKKNI